MQKIAIVIPYHKSEIDKYEKISLEFAKKKFIKYDKFFLIPNQLKLNFDIANFQIKKIEPDHFSTYLKYNQFLINNKFYEIFKNYDYILIYQLDCLFFSNEIELEKFMLFDFIGSPHINIKKKRFTGVYNGGFSLRKVHACIEVLNSRKFNLYNFKKIQMRYFLSIKRFFHLIKFFSDVIIKYIANKYFMKKNTTFTNIFLIIFSKYFNEDVFWSLFANLFKKDFSLPDFEKALSFAFDKDPQIMFKLNNHKLPLGCHCWFKDGNHDFWKKFI